MRDKLRETVQKLVREIAEIRIGLIAHGDYIDHRSYVVKMEDFTRDVQRMETFVMDAPKTMGGGDNGEVREVVGRLGEIMGR